MSRLWGYLNSLELPVWFRPTGFRLYALVFGCNLDEIEPSDLHKYASLGDFFYRKLKDGVRPIDDAILVCPDLSHPCSLTLIDPLQQVSPADGKVLHLGTIKGLRVEQVKGLTYSLDALLGIDKDGPTEIPTTTDGLAPNPERDMEIVTHREFANVNGIEYSLDQLLGVSPASSPGDMTPALESPGGHRDADALPKKHGELEDASVKPDENGGQSIVRDASVVLEMGVKPAVLGSGTDVGCPRVSGGRKNSIRNIKEGHELFFAVIYLAPGDYHRFHSPTAWVVEKRRHFIGNFTTSPPPYIARS